MNDTSHNSASGDGQLVVVFVAWTLVGIPLAWGIYNTLLTATKLFGW